MALIDLDADGSMVLYQGVCPVCGIKTALSTSQGEATGELAQHIVVTHSQIITVIKIQVTPA